MTDSIHCTSRVGSLASRAAPRSSSGQIRLRLVPGVGAVAWHPPATVWLGEAAFADAPDCSVPPTARARHCQIAFQLESQGSGRARFHALARGPLKGRRQGIIQRGGNPDVEAAPHESQPQRFAGFLRHAQAVAAANTLAGLVDDQGMIDADVDLASRRGVAVASRPELLGGLAQAAGVCLAAIATATSASLAHGFLAGQAQPAQPRRSSGPRGVGSATAMNCGISSGRRHLT